MRAENVRTVFKTSDTRTECITDSSSSLSRVLMTSEYSKNDDEYIKSKENVYYYGNTLIYENSKTYSEDEEVDKETVLVYHYNNIGSTVALTDIDGNVASEYTYGTYGELLSGDTTIIGFLYNGSIANSQSLNKYSYVQGNPVSLMEPLNH